MRKVALWAMLWTILASSCVNTPSFETREESEGLEPSASEPSASEPVPGPAVSEPGLEPSVEPAMFPEDSVEPAPEVVDLEMPQPDTGEEDGSEPEMRVDMPEPEPAAEPQPQPEVLTVVAEDWSQGLVPEDMPRGALLPLPGEGAGNPVITSNNPESFTGPGLLLGTARPTQTRGGDTYALAGRFGVYLHHLNNSGEPLWVTVMATNPNPNPVTVEVFGAAWTQDEAGGIGLGISPDYRVSEAWLFGDYRTEILPTEIPSLRPLRVWSGLLNHGREVDGRFDIRATEPVYLYIVASETDDLNDALMRGLEDAPGDYRTAGDPPPPFAREAGVYAHDRWAADFSVGLPQGPAHVGFMVNTATGAGFSQVQAFPALMHYEGSAQESVGMYGNVYDVRMELVHPGGDTRARNVRVWFASLSQTDVSRYWDGAGRVNNQPIAVRHVPGDVATLLWEGIVSPNERTSVHFEAMVPGLTSIPQALYIETQ